MQYRFGKKDLLDTLGRWNDFLRKKIHLIACGGTALTLLGIKDTTKDMDFIIPIESEYDYLIKVLQDLGYKPVTGAGWSRGDNRIFDLFRGEKVHTTDLLESPLKESNHLLLKEFSYLYLGVLNYYDIIITKLFRATGVDINDCLALVKARQDQIDINLLKKRFLETSSYDVSEKKVNKNLEYFLGILKEERVYGE